MTWQVEVGDCREVLAGLPDNSFEAVVSDPPYGISFMGNSDWDGQVPGVEFWSAFLRVAKPGAHLLAFGGTRTWHRMAVAIEDAGWEIRDSMMWLYGSGFPKSHNIGKAIDKRPGIANHAAFAAALVSARESAGLSRADLSEAVVGTRSGACWNWEHHQFPEHRHWGAISSALPTLSKRWGDVLAEAEREVVGTNPNVERSWSSSSVSYSVNSGSSDITAPATDLARQWEGWGTALKPAWEPIIVARKKPEGTVAGNVERWGCGGLNVDGCRVGTDDNLNGGTMGGCFGNGKPTIDKPIGTGRWPANLILDPEAGAMLDEQAGERPSATSRSRPAYNATSYHVGTGGGPCEFAGETGGPSRFFMQVGGILSRAESILDAWTNDPANTVEPSSILSRSAVDSALNGAATSANLGAIASSEWPEPIMNVTPNESRRICVTAMLAILSIAGEFSPASLPTKPTQKHGLVSGAARNVLTGTTTITVSHWRSDGSADPVTFSITPPSEGRGEAASRFSYCPKASKADRNSGCEGMEDSARRMFASGGRTQIDGKWVETNSEPMPRKNHHPTVKPTDLMRYLCRLVTPPGGTVLDPFTGSGSTGKAAVLEGFNFFGCELSPEYADIARARIGHEANEPSSLWGVA